MTSRTAPLYVVCSPRRCVGKTLLARLLTEFYVLDDRTVAAFDLADEAPQLADYLPQFTTIGDIADVPGQMAFFERLTADADRARIIDLSHRTFNRFFNIVEEIGFFEEACRRCIEPMILFITDADPTLTEIYASLRRRFPHASLLPVRNRTEAGASSRFGAPESAGFVPDSLQIPLLGLARMLIENPSSSFRELWQATQTSVPDLLADELREWLEHIFWQFRSLEHSLGWEHKSTRTVRPGSSRLRRAHFEGRPMAQPGGSFLHHATAAGRPTDTPYEVLRYAPKRTRREGIPIEQFGTTIVGMLEKAAGELRAAKDQIKHLEGEIRRVEGSSVRAESWLQLLGKEIEEKLAEPAAATRSKIEDLAQLAQFEGDFYDFEVGQASQIKGLDPAQG